MPQGDSVLTIVALGDSVVWGNGLKDPDKFVEIAGQQIANKTQRSVQIVSFAHSGAKLADHPDASQTPPGNGYVPIIDTDNHVPPGDLNSSYPTTSEQADCATVAYPGAEIVVLDGCINEVNATDIALPPVVNHTTTQEIEERVFKYCSESMRATIGKVKAAFPRATIIVINYYQIVSEESSIFRVANEPATHVSKVGSSEKELKRVIKEANKIQRLRTEPADTRVGQEDVRRWPDNSKAFLKNSQACFEWAIAARPSDVLRNAGTEDDPACPLPPAPAPSPTPDAIKSGSTVYLATVLNLPQFAYGAKEKHIWSLPVQFLFWTIHADDMYRARKGLCKTHYRGQGQAETREVCRINPIAHPNKLGADAYACSIVLSPDLKCDPNQRGLLDLLWAAQ
jgi:hypothetical protein